MNVKSQCTGTAQLTQDSLKLGTPELLDALGNVTLYALVNPRAAVQLALPAVQMLQGCMLAFETQNPNTKGTRF